MLSTALIRVTHSAEPTEAPTARIAGFDALYDATVDFAWRVLVRLGVPTSQIEDAVQDVYLVVHRRRDAMPPGVEPKAWVAGIAIKVAHDYRRRLHRKAPGVSLEAAAHVADAGAHADPSALTTQRQAKELVLALLEQLEEEQRTVFVLAELEELTAPQIADITGVGVNTVYSRLRLARARFDAAVARFHGAGGDL